jgi:carbon storage regulator
MLYLTRKIGESIVINDDIEVTVVDVRGKSIKLGLTFPEDVSVYRREVYERILAEQNGEPDNALSHPAKTPPTEPVPARTFFSLFGSVSERSGVPRGFRETRLPCSHSDPRDAAEVQRHSPRK